MRVLYLCTVLDITTRPWASPVIWGRDCKNEVPLGSVAQLCVTAISCHQIFIFPQHTLYWLTHERSMKIAMVYVWFLELEHEAEHLPDTVCKPRAGEVQLLVCMLHHLLCYAMHNTALQWQQNGSMSYLVISSLINRTCGTLLHFVIIQSSPPISRSSISLFRVQWRTYSASEEEFICKQFMIVSAVGDNETGNVLSHSVVLLASLNMIF